jgi:hypothetical protein
MKCIHILHFSSILNIGKKVSWSVGLEETTMEVSFELNPQIDI